VSALRSDAVGYFKASQSKDRALLGYEVDRERVRSQWSAYKARVALTRLKFRAARIANSADLPR
jgi:hypothetical protein